MKNHRNVGTLKVLALLALLALGLASCSAEEGTTQKTGQAFDWGAAEDEWVVVNYWAEWCQPCLEEIPELNALDEEPQVRVLGVNYDGITGVELDKLIDKMDIRYTALRENPADELGWEQPVGLPATYIINPEGELVETLLGAQTREGLLAIIADSAGR